MKKTDVINLIFKGDMPLEPFREKGLAFSPINIALCKYWGKRDTELNLPVTSSLSVALPDRGTMTSLKVVESGNDVIVLNNKEIASKTEFAQRTSDFLDLFRPANNWKLLLEITSTVPIAAGLASSASGFASLTCALNDLFNWQLDKRYLSILARFGSGSAVRSLWTGFVEWHAGAQADGMDSFGEPIDAEWPNLCLGIVAVNNKQKSISSREAMQRTVDTSLLYSVWAKKVYQDLSLIKQAIRAKNFSLLGGIAESNALTMHATMLSSWPPVCYFLPDTIAAMHQVWQARKEGVEVYFTQDAGPNLKLLFLESNRKQIKALFPKVDIIKPFE